MPLSHAKLWALYDQPTCSLERVLSAFVFLEGRAIAKLAVAHHSIEL